MHNFGSGEVTAANMTKASKSTNSKSHMDLMRLLNDDRHQVSFLAPKDVSGRDKRIDFKGSYRVEGEA